MRQQRQYGASEQASQPTAIGGQQPTGATQGTPPGAPQQGMPTGLRFEEGVTNEMQMALFDVTEAVKVCEWCADQCLDEGPGMATCVRLCEDVTEIGALNLELGARDSMFSLDAAELFVSAAEACRDECAQHSHAHCQDCAQVLDRAVQSTRQLLSSFGGGGMAGGRTGSSQQVGGGQSMGGMQSSVGQF
jgi:hypothetical protein